MGVMVENLQNQSRADMLDDSSFFTSQDRLENNSGLDQVSSHIQSLPYCDEDQLKTLHSDVGSETAARILEQGRKDFNSYTHKINDAMAKHDLQKVKIELELLRHLAGSFGLLRLEAQLAQIVDVFSGEDANKNINEITSVVTPVFRLISTSKKYLS